MNKSQTQNCLTKNKKGAKALTKGMNTPQSKPTPRNWKGKSGIPENQNTNPAESKAQKQFTPKGGP